MSSGAFTISKYEDDDDVVRPIRLQPETLAAVIGGVTNAPPAGSVLAATKAARARGSKRAIGIVARWASFTWTAAAPAGYKAGGVGRIPLLTEAAYDAATYGATGTYLGAGITITGRGGEGGR